MREYPEEMQYINKKNKVNQTEKIVERKCKTAVIELKELKNISIKQVYEQIKILSELTKIKLKNLHLEKETSEEVIKALRSMTKTKIDSVPDKEVQTKQFQKSLKKR